MAIIKPQATQETLTAATGHLYPFRNARFRSGQRNRSLSEQHKSSGKGYGKDGVARSLFCASQVRTRTGSPRGSLASS